MADIVAAEVAVGDTAAAAVADDTAVAGTAAAAGIAAADTAAEERAAAAAGTAAADTAAGRCHGARHRIRGGAAEGVCLTLSIELVLNVNYLTWLD